MAGKKKKKNGMNLPSVIITIIAVILAVGAIVFLVVTMNSDNDPTAEPDINVNTTPAFQVTDELKEQTEQATYDLLQKNFKAYQHFTRGMTHEPEPYGNLPEDGFYTCISDEYKSFDDFSDFIESIYTEETAEKLLTDPFGSGPVYGVDDKGGLGLSSDFTPSEEGLPWANVEFVCTPVSETECTVKYTLKDSSENVVKEGDTKLILEEGQWKLTEMIGG